MANFFLFVLLFFVPLHCAAHTLGDEFKKAEVGDFIVFQHQKHITLLRIAEKDEKSLAVEEITTQESSVDPKTISWESWLENFAPGHTSWIVSRFNLPDFAVESVFSYTTNEWIGNEPLFQFLPTLLNLPLEPVKKEDRKRIGPPPSEGEIDFRKEWLPKIIFNAKVIPTECHVFKTSWPKDGGELAGKTLYLYIPISKECLNYFPYWIEIAGRLAKVKLRVIDSGKGLLAAPHKPPQT